MDGPARLCFIVSAALGDLTEPAWSSMTELYSAMRARRRTVREVEIKVRVRDLAGLVRDLGGLGAIREGRVLERNTLYDTPDSDFHRRGRLLRLRIETPAPSGPILGGRRRTVITSKIPAPRAPNARYKQNLEREAEVSPVLRWANIFRSLGLRPGFQYEKYRTVFRLHGLHLDLDETPVGVFLELEGAPRAIDSAARALGYSARDYIRQTYWGLYQTECLRRGRLPRNMLFPA